MAEKSRPAHFMQIVPKGIAVRLIKDVPIQTGGVGYVVGGE